MNIDRYPEEIEADFDLKYFEAYDKQKQFCHLAGDISFLMAECGGCGKTMPFEFDDGVCMLCGCDAAEGIISEMNEEEFTRLVENNTFRMHLKWPRRRPFENLCQLIDRQIQIRVKTALQIYENNKTTRTQEDYGKAGISRTAEYSRRTKEIHPKQD